MHCWVKGTHLCMSPSVHECLYVAYAACVCVAMRVSAVYARVLVYARKRAVHACLYACMPSLDACTCACMHASVPECILKSVCRHLLAHTLLHYVMICHVML